MADILGVEIGIRDWNLGDPILIPILKFGIGNGIVGIKIEITDFGIRHRNLQGRLSRVVIEF